MSKKNKPLVRKEVITIVAERMIEVLFDYEYELADDFADQEVPEFRKTDPVLISHEAFEAIEDRWTDLYTEILKEAVKELPSHLAEDGD